MSVGSSVSPRGYVIFMSISTYMSKTMGRPCLHIIAWTISTWVLVIQNIWFLWSSSSKGSLFALSITPCLLFYDDARSVFLWRLLCWPAEMETIRCKVLGLMVYVQMFPAACMEDWQFRTQGKFSLYHGSWGSIERKHSRVTIKWRVRCAGWYTWSHNVFSTEFI